MNEIETEFTEVGGGRAGIHEFGWRMANYNLDEIEPLRQKLLRQKNYAPIQKAMQQLGIVVSQAILQAVKRYNFDSQGIGFRYDNYTIVQSSPSKDLLNLLRKQLFIKVEHDYANPSRANRTYRRFNN